MSKIVSTGNVIPSTKELRLIRLRVENKNLLTARQLAHNVKCDDCGKVYLSSSGTCPKCHSRRRSKTSG